MKPEVVTQGMAEFSKPQYRVDVLRVGVPVNINFAEGSLSVGKEILCPRAETIAHYRRAGAAARMSQGVNNEAFQFALELAAEAGVNFNGVLCRRATRQDGVAVFAKNGAKALEDWLLQEGVKNIENMNRHLKNAQSCLSSAAEAAAARHSRRKGEGGP